MKSVNPKRPLPKIISPRDLPIAYLWLSPLFKAVALNNYFNPLIHSKEDILLYDPVNAFTYVWICVYIHIYFHVYMNCSSYMSKIGKHWQFHLFKYKKIVSLTMRILGICNHCGIFYFVLFNFQDISVVTH